MHLRNNGANLVPGWFFVVVVLSKGSGALERRLNMSEWPNTLSIFFSLPQLQLRTVLFIFQFVIWDWLFFETDKKALDRWTDNSDWPCQVNMRTMMFSSNWKWLFDATKSTLGYLHSWPSWAYIVLVNNQQMVQHHQHDLYNQPRLWWKCQQKWN